MAPLSSRLPALRAFAVPSVCLLICFLAYSSQYLFYYLDPGPLTRKEAAWFNLLVGGTWWSYARACTVDPGRLPKSIAEAGLKNHQDIKDEIHDTSVIRRAARGRWCKKCEAVKPPRSHHCRQCGRCIPKMDHHCPWTSNCVSHTTFPHFLRFVYYTCASLILLGYHLYIRIYAVYAARNLPSYLGPSIWALVHIMVLIFITILLLFALTVLLVTATWSLLTNTTMIEAWEIERHQALVEKAQRLGGYLYGPGGRRIRIKRQEFPYDIGLWKNILQGMGTAKFFVWLLPFAGGPDNDVGWGPWEVNGFEDEEIEWPPMDPDKLPRSPPQVQDQDDRAFTHDDEDEVQAFRRRQEEDIKRWEIMRQRKMPSSSKLAKSSAAMVQEQDECSDRGTDDEDYESDEYEEGMDGEAGWTNSDGDRLRDYGVDEDAELILDIDDVPLGELLRRRRAVARESD